MLLLVLLLLLKEEIKRAESSDPDPTGSNTSGCSERDTILLLLLLLLLLVITEEIKRAECRSSDPRGSPTSGCSGRVKCLLLLVITEEIKRAECRSSDPTGSPTSGCSGRDTLPPCPRSWGNRRRNWPVTSSLTSPQRIDCHRHAVKGKKGKRQKARGGDSYDVLLTRCVNKVY